MADPAVNGVSGHGVADPAASVRIEGTGRARFDLVVPCRDVVGRTRSVTVVGDRCGVVLVAPPGEVAVLSEDNVAVLCSALRAAACGGGHR